MNGRTNTFRLYDAYVNAANMLMQYLARLREEHGLSAPYVYSQPFWYFENLMGERRMEKIPRELFSQLNITTEFHQSTCCF